MLARLLDVTIAWLLAGTLIGAWWLAGITALVITAWAVVRAIMRTITSAKPGNCRLSER
jgi:hypothetical protein